MLRRTGIAPCVIAVAVALAAAAPTSASINLEYNPAFQVVNLGQFFDVEFYAASDSQFNQSISSIDLLLDWDPTYLRLVGKTDNGPYGWLSSEFPNDSGLDGLNAPYGPVPGNDGDAYYRAFRQFPPTQPAYAPPAGLLVTTFHFEALAMTPSTDLLMMASSGQFSRTYVVDGFTAGLEVTGNLGSAKIEIVPEPATAALALMGMALLLRRGRSRRV
jgi:hypothetical protein